MKYLIYMLVASVFLGTEILAIPLFGSQLSFYRMLVVITTIVILIKIIIKDPNIEFSISDRLNFYQLVYIIWFLYALLSIFWVESIARWVFGVFFVGLGTFSIVVITFFITRKKEIVTLFYIFFFMTAIHQWLGWYEVLTENYLWGGNTFGAPVTTFGNINDYATLLLAGMFFGIIIFFITNNNIIRIYSIIHLISGCLLLSISGSRGNQLALIIGVLTIIIINIIDRKMSRKVIKLSTVLISVYALLLIFIPQVQVFSIQTIEFLISNFFRIGGSNRYRVNLLLNGFYFLIQTYGFGVGAGNIEHWMNYRPVIADIDAVNIHNWFVEILVGYGIFIFTLYIIMYVYIIRQLYLNYRYADSLFVKNTSMVLLSYVVAFIASSISSASNIFIEWQWIMWGIILTFALYSERLDA